MNRKESTIQKCTKLLLYVTFCLNSCLLERQLRHWNIFQSLMASTSPYYFVRIRAADCKCDAGPIWKCLSDNPDEACCWSLKNALTLSIPRKFSVAVSKIQNLFINLIVKMHRMAKKKYRHVVAAVVHLRKIAEIVSFRVHLAGFD